MANVRISSVAFRAAAVRLPGYHTYTGRKAEEVTEVAAQVFNQRQRRDNERRTSETTPPKYVDSFYTRREGDDWFAGNDDPAANLVEFGAHAGGRTPVLKYRSILTAINILQNREGG